MNKIINEYGKEFYTDVTENDEFNNNLFHEVKDQLHDDYQLAFHSNLGSITVLDRLTGFGWRDIETGFRSTDNKFWLASGNYDIRKDGCKTIADAIEKIKHKANTCKGK
jgi:hypothetical protein